jgi:cytochrome c-type biogenesis protein CcmE
MAGKKVRFAAGFAVIGLCLLYLVISGFQKTAMYYFTVGELEARELEFVGERIKLAGRVVPGSIQTDPRTLEVAFRIWEPGGKGFEPDLPQRPVRYRGIVPDTFKDEADVILEGEVVPGGVFHAESLLAKCPSKYEGKSYQEMKAAHSQESI